MSEGGEPNLQVDTKPESHPQVATKPDPEKLHELAHVIALKLEASSEKASQTQSGPLDQGTQPSSTATSRSGGITENDIQKMQAILNEIGNGQMLVVPSSIELQPGNPAITLSDNFAQIRTYKRSVDAYESRYDQSVDVKDWVEKLGTNTILVSETVVGMSPIEQRGIIYHEFGHTFISRAETAQVFVHELKRLLDKYPQEQVTAWVGSARNAGKYYVPYATGDGANELIEIVGKLGFRLSEAKDEAPQTQQKPKASKVKQDTVITGELKYFTMRAGTAENLPPGLADMDPGTRFEWAGWNWEVCPRTPTGYRLELVATTRHDLAERVRTNTRPGQKAEGPLAQIKSSVRASQDVPAEIANLQVGRTLEWYDSTWELIGKLFDHKIKVVND